MTGVTQEANHADTAMQEACQAAFTAAHHSQQGPSEPAPHADQELHGDPETPEDHLMGEEQGTLEIAQAAQVPAEDQAMADAEADAVMQAPDQAADEPHADQVRPKQQPFQPTEPQQDKPADVEMGILDAAITETEQDGPPAHADTAMQDAPQAEEAPPEKPKTAGGTAEQPPPATAMQQREDGVVKKSAGSAEPLEAAGGASTATPLSTAPKPSVQQAPGVTQRASEPDAAHFPSKEGVPVIGAEDQQQAAVLSGSMGKASAVVRPASAGPMTSADHGIKQQPTQMRSAASAPALQQAATPDATTQLQVLKPTGFNQKGSTGFAAPSGQPGLLGNQLGGSAITPPLLRMWTPQAAPSTLRASSFLVILSLHSRAIPLLLVTCCRCLA